MHNAYFEHHHKKSQQPVPKDEYDSASNNLGGLHSNHLRPHLHLNMVTAFLEYIVYNLSPLLPV